MIETIRSIDLLGGSSSSRFDDICLSRDTVKNLFKLLLIGVMTMNGSWAQGSSNWAYDHCDSVISELRENKIVVNDSFFIICNAAKFHGSIVTVDKQKFGRDVKTISHNSTDSTRVPLSIEARETANIIREMCISDPNFKEARVNSFGSDCERILINLKNFFSEYDALEVIDETEKSVGAFLGTCTSEMHYIRIHMEKVKQAYY